MSNRQLPWDDKRIRDRIAPREDAQADKEQFQQQTTDERHEAIDGQDDNWVPPLVAAQGKRCSYVLRGQFGNVPDSPLSSGTTRSILTSNRYSNQ